MKHSKALSWLGTGYAANTCKAFLPVCLVSNVACAHLLCLTAALHRASFMARFRSTSRITMLASCVSRVVLSALNSRALVSRMHLHHHTAAKQPCRAQSKRMSCAFAQTCQLHASASLLERMHCTSRSRRIAHSRELIQMDTHAECGAGSPKRMAPDSTAQHNMACHLQSPKARASVSNQWASGVKPGAGPLRDNG